MSFLDRVRALALAPSDDAPVMDGTSDPLATVPPQQGPGVPLSLEEQQALRALDQFYESQSDQARREYVKKCAKARWYLKGAQYLAWDQSTQSYRIAGSTGLQTFPLGEDVNSAYVINIFQGFFLSAAQLIVANPPTEKFFPESAENPKDVQAAKVADQVITRHQQMTDVLDEQLTIWLQLWCDGTSGAYTRYVVDGDRFGYREEPIYEAFEAQMGPDTYQCADCASSMPAEANTMGVCPSCGSPMGPESFVPGPTGPGTRQTGTRRVPLGQVVTDNIGGLELRLPPNAKDLWQYPFIKWNLEVDPALLRSAYPHVQEKIQANVSSAPGDEYERRSRLQLATGTTTENRRIGEKTNDLVTFRRTWLRPWAFAGIDDPAVAASLKQKFPDGVFMAWADDTFCEARPEKIDDHWVITHGLPGEGTIREPIGACLIEVQEIVNDFVNIARDVTEFTLPATFADDGIVDIDAFQRSRVQAGAIYAAHTKAGSTVAGAFHEMAAGTLPPHTMELLQQLMNQIPQFLVGTFPASFGGDLGGNDTKGGIEIERDQAMGRMGMWLKRITGRYRQVMPQNVRAFAENQIDPVTMCDENDGGQFEDSRIDPEELKAGKYRMRPEIAEGYPVTWADKRNLYGNLMANPQTAGLFTYQPNVASWKRIVGFDGEVPGEMAWKKQLNEIQMLLQSAPVQGPPVPGPMGLVPGPMQPTVPVDPVLDDNATELAACQYWASSDQGQEMRLQNPAGFANVQAHAQMHQMALTPPAPPPGAEGEGKAPDVS